YSRYLRKNINDRFVPVGRSELSWRLAVVVLFVRVGPKFHQQFDMSDIVFSSHRMKEGGCTLLVDGVNLRTILQKPCGHLELFPCKSRHQRRIHSGRPVDKGSVLFE